MQKRFFVVVGGLLTVAVGAWLSALLLEVFKVSDSAKWLGEFVASEWYRYILIAAISLAIGVGLDWAARRFDGSKKKRLTALAADLRGTVYPLQKVREALEAGDLSPGTTPGAIEARAMNYRGALRSAEVAGLTVPWLDYLVDPIGYLDVSIAYVNRVAPLLERGHLKDAKAISADEATRSKQYIAARARL